MEYTLKAHFNYFSNELSLSRAERMKWQSLFERYPEINWRDALGPSQLRSKRYLLKHLKDFCHSETQVVSVGGWVGLTEYLMHMEKIPRKLHLNLDLDELALKVSYGVNSSSENYCGLHLNALDFNYQLPHLLVINTSCEHIDHFDQWLSLLPQGTRCILQSNNMFGIAGHVNCQRSLEDFMGQAPLSHYFDQQVIHIGNDWQRFTLVGEV